MSSIGSCHPFSSKFATVFVFLTSWRSDLNFSLLLLGSETLLFKITVIFYYLYKASLYILEFLTLTTYLNKIIHMMIDVEIVRNIFNLIPVIKIISSFELSVAERQRLLRNKYVNIVIPQKNDCLLSLEFSIISEQLQFFPSD